MENSYKLLCGLNVKCLKQVHVLTAWSLAGGEGPLWEMMGILGSGALLE